MEDPQMSSHCDPLDTIQEVQEDDYWAMANTCIHPEYQKEDQSTNNNNLFENIEDNVT